MVHYLTNAMENQWISHSLPDYLLEASLVYLNLMKMKIRSWTVVQVISRKKVLHTRLLKDKAAYTIKEDGTSETVEITNRYYTNVNPSEGVWTEHMKLYLFMAGAGILMILFMILRKTRFRGRNEG